MRAPVGQGKQRLLDALFEEFGESGPSPNLSDRAIAERLGVHHTLLTYHFGSRGGLLAAVLAEARRRDNAAILAGDREIGFIPLCMAIWQRYAGDEHGERARAFFQVVGIAASERDGLPQILGDTIGELMNELEAAALRDGYTPAAAKYQSVIVVACLRGLLLQRLVTPDADVSAAAERFITSLTPPPPER